MRQLLVPAVWLSVVLQAVSVAEARDKASWAVTDSSRTVFFNPPVAASASDDPWLDPLADWPVNYAVLNSGLLRTSHTSFGTFGSTLGPAIEGWLSSRAGFEVPAGSGINYLFGGALWIGGVVNGDTLVSVGADGWFGLQEMFPDIPGKGITKVLGAGDCSYRSEFTDTNRALAPIDPGSGRPHEPLNVRVANRSHVWRIAPDDAVVIYDMVVTNIGYDPIDEGYLGFYMDADVFYDNFSGYGFDDDLTGSIRSLGTAYIIDNDGDFEEAANQGGKTAARAFCFRMTGASTPITETNYNWWISNGYGALDFGPRLRGTPEDPFRDLRTGGLGTPNGDANKYYFLRHREWDYDQVLMASIGSNDSLWLQPPDALAPDFSDGFDTRFLLSVGPFNLAPGASERFVAAMFTTDSIHISATNADNLPHQPELYLAGLDLSSLTTYAQLSDQLTERVLDPMLPPIGLREVAKGEGSVTVAWDPWCFGDVTGYHVYIAPVPAEDLPYPGVVAPWLTPQSWTEVALVGADVTEYTFENLPSDQFFMISVAHEGTGGAGATAPPLFVRGSDRFAAPTFAGDYAFAPAWAAVELNWTVPDGADIDHFNLYRFNSKAETDVYHAFYDSGYAALTRTPVETFPVGDDEYFYYALTPYQTLPGGTRSLNEMSIWEGATYVLTSVDHSGRESHFSAPIEVVRTPDRDKDILVNTHGVKTGMLFMDFADVRSYYDSVLSGYSYDLYDWADSNSAALTIDLHLLMRYRLVIIDDDLNEKAFNKTWEAEQQAFSKYLLSGGRLAYFGTFVQFTSLNYLMGAATSSDLDAPFLNRFFGIDSVHFVPAAALFAYVWPYADTVYGFQQALPVDGRLPMVLYDQSRGRIHSGTTAQRMWPSNAPLSVATFVPSGAGEVSLSFGSDPSINSVAEGKPVGVVTTGGEWETYAFGFHLWYCESVGARALVDAVFSRGVSVASEPDTLVVGEEWLVSPEAAEIVVGNLPQGRSVFTIDPGTVRVAGTVVPVGVNYRAGESGFLGDVMVLTVVSTDLVQALPAYFGTRMYALPVGGEYSGGEAFELQGAVVVAGRAPGDLNADGTINLMDLTYQVDYLFRGGHSERSDIAYDVNGDCSGDIRDVTAMVHYLFGPGVNMRWCVVGG